MQPTTKENTRRKRKIESRQCQVKIKQEYHIIGHGSQRKSSFFLGFSRDRSGVGTENKKAAAGLVKVHTSSQ